MSGKPKLYIPRKAFARDFRVGPHEILCFSFHTDAIGRYALLRFGDGSIDRLRGDAGAALARRMGHTFDDTVQGERP